LAALRAFDSNLRQFGLGSAFSDADAAILEEVTLVSDFLSSPSISDSFSNECKIDGVIDFQRTPIFNIPINADAWQILDALVFLAVVLKQIDLVVSERLRLSDGDIKKVFGRTVHKDEDAGSGGSEVILESREVTRLVAALSEAKAINLAYGLNGKGLSPDYIRLPFIEKFSIQP